MKRVIAVIIATLFLGIFLVDAQTKAQTKKKPAPKGKPKAGAHTASQKPAAGPPRLIGTHVEVVTRNGDRLSGDLVDLSAYSIKIRSDKLDSSLPLDSIASVYFGEVSIGGGGRQSQSSPPLSTDFSHDAAFALRQFQTVATNLKSGIDYSDFKQQVADLRRTVDRIIVRYAGTESVAELRVLSLLIAGETDYDWSRAIWTLKFGRSSDGLAYDAESPELSAALTTYSDLKAIAASGNKYTVEKVIAGLWQKATEKADRARALIGPAR